MKSGQHGHDKFCAGGCTCPREMEKRVRREYESRKACPTSAASERDYNAAVTSKIQIETLLSHEMGVTSELKSANERLLAALEKCKAIGPWMSAALDDSKVCDKMKADIHTFFDGLEQQTEKVLPAGK